MTLDSASAARAARHVVQDDADPGRCRVGLPGRLDLQPARSRDRDHDAAAHTDRAAVLGRPRAHVEAATGSGLDVGLTQPAGHEHRVDEGVPDDDARQV